MLCKPYMKQAWKLTMAAAGHLQELKPTLGYGFPGQNTQDNINLPGSLFPAIHWCGNPFCELRCDKCLCSSFVNHKKENLIFFFLRAGGGEMGLVSYFSFIPYMGHGVTIPSVILAQLEGLACWKCIVRSEQWVIREQDWLKSMFVTVWGFNFLIMEPNNLAFF